MHEASKPLKLSSPKPVSATNSEIMYIVSGTATFTVGDTVETVQAGQCHYCPKGGTHMLQNRGEEPLVFFAVVTEQ